MGPARKELPPMLNSLSEQIIGAAIEVHRTLGPGLLEKIYEEALVHELTLRGLLVDRQTPVKLTYKGVELVGQRLDLLVQQRVVVELKSVEQVLDVHLAQLLGYLRAGNYPLGLLINFNVSVLTKGIHRRINSASIASVPGSHPSASSA
jgi:GxxExxY protein